MTDDSKQEQQEVQQLPPYPIWGAIDKTGFVAYVKFSLTLNPRLDLKALFYDEIDNQLTSGQLKVLEDNVGKVTLQNAKSHERLLQIQYLHDQGVANVYCEGSVVGRMQISK